MRSVGTHFLRVEVQRKKPTLLRWVSRDPSHLKALKLSRKLHDVHEIFVLRFESAIERVWESWSELIQRMLLLFSLALSVEAKRTGQRVPKGFSAPGISPIWIKLGIRRLKTKLEWDSGLKVCLDGMPKIILGKPDCTKFWVGITGLKNIMGDPLDMPLNSSWIVYKDNSRSSRLIQCSPGRIRQSRIVFLTSDSQIL